MFEIVIKNTKVVDKIIGGEWVTVGYEKELDSSGKQVPKRGYSPDIVKKRTETFTVLSQEKEELDLIAVIKAINGIE